MADGWWRHGGIQFPPRCLRSQSLNSTIHTYESVLCIVFGLWKCYMYLDSIDTWGGNATNEYTVDCWVMRWYVRYDNLMAWHRQWQLGTLRVDWCEQISNRFKYLLLQINQTIMERLYSNLARIGWSEMAKCGFFLKNSYWNIAFSLTLYKMNIVLAINCWKFVGLESKPNWFIHNFCRKQ